MNLNDGRPIHRQRRPGFGETVAIEVEVKEYGFVIWTAECGVPMSGGEAKEWLNHFIDTWQKLAEARAAAEIVG